MKENLRKLFLRVPHTTHMYVYIYVRPPSTVQCERQELYKNIRRYGYDVRIINEANKPKYVEIM